MAALIAAIFYTLFIFYGDARLTVSSIILTTHKSELFAQMPGPPPDALLGFLGSLTIAQK